MLSHLEKVCRATKLPGNHFYRVGLLLQPSVLYCEYCNSHQTTVMVILVISALLQMKYMEI